MKKTKYLILSVLVVSFLFSSCRSKKEWVLERHTTVMIPIDASKEGLASEKMNRFISPYKKQLDKKMDVVLGQSAVAMEKGRPESLLSNWSADVYRELASDFLKKPVDMGVVNLGGLRADLPKGDITVRHIFQLMPFENELSIVWLKGSEIKELFDIFAKEDGQGISGATFEIKNRKAQNCKIGGKPIVDNQLYSVATNDYLASGNDRMVTFKKGSKRLDTNLKLREIFMQYVINQAKKGQKLNPKLDNRIVLIREK